MDRSGDQHLEQHIAVSTAAAITYHQVNGTELTFKDVAEMNEILHRVAHALANVAPIYAAREDAAAPQALDPMDLLYGAFQRGATIFRTPYAEYRKLTIRRSVAILRRAGVKFPSGETQR